MHCAQCLLWKFLYLLSGERSFTPSITTCSDDTNLLHLTECVYTCRQHSPAGCIVPIRNGRGVFTALEADATYAGLAAH